MTEKSKPEIEIDEPSGVETTGHEWDGIKELNNPLPRWWLWTFYATIVFALGYVLYYPAIPLLEASTMGISGQTNRSILKSELAEVDNARRDRSSFWLTPGSRKSEPMKIWRVSQRLAAHRFSRSIAPNVMVLALPVARATPI